MKFLIIIICFTVGLVLSGCKKDTEEKACWQILDFTGNFVTTICDKTETELLECARNGSCGYSGGASFSDCNYFKIEGPKYCWQIGNNYVNDITENHARLIARCYNGGATPLKIDCSLSCRRWYHREKKTYKPTGSITYSHVTAQVFCGDTLTTIFQGRQIIRKNDADSLIVIQFSNNGMNW